MKSDEWGVLEVPSINPNHPRVQKAVQNLQAAWDADKMAVYKPVGRPEKEGAIQAVAFRQEGERRRNLGRTHAWQRLVMDGKGAWGWHA